MTHDALKHSDLVITASGTATLEAALLERPMIVVYRVSPITWLLGKFMVHVPFYSMVNILAGRAIVPELIQNAFTAGALTDRAAFLLDHPEALQAMVVELQALRPRLGPGGAIHRAAEAIYQMLEEVQAAPASI
jgi:lipid-A-disaccharide synthase